MSDIIKHKNGLRFNKNGWIYVSIHGKPYERGLAHGTLLAKEIKDALNMLKFMSREDYGESYEWFAKKAVEVFQPYMLKHHKEYLDEMKGIADGASLTLDDILLWNGFIPLYEYWYPNHISETTPHVNYKYMNPLSYKKDRCSAFIATGSYTKDGEIVIGHNTFDEFLTGQYGNIILNIKPEKGNDIIMQSYPGFIWSATDYYVCSNGMAMTEVTLGGFSEYKIGNPVFCRVRQAMQYGNAFNEIRDNLLQNNTGGYANSWLIGNTKTNEICRIELGLYYHSFEVKKDGYFIGFNAPYDPKIRNIECHNSGFHDIRRHQGARRKRLTELMNQYKGKIDLKIGQKIMADHYDVYLKKKNNPCSRTVCSHYDLDAREFMSDPSRPKPFQPRGAMDGKLCTSDMIKKMSFSARWGTSCGKPFIAEKHFKDHAEWDFLKGYLKDRPRQPWTTFKGL